MRLIVVHTAEGATTYQSLGNYFANPASKVSSHVGIDDTANTVGEYVARSGSAWTQANYNSVSTAAELCAFAAWSAQTWAAHPTMLANCAAWIAEEAAAYNIPITRLTAAQAQSNGRGVCGHVDLGAGGGNHTDPGPAFPWAQVLSMAAGGGPAPPKPDYGGAVFIAVATTDSANDPNIKKNYQFVVKEAGVATIATPADSSALQAKLGPLVSLTGNQIAAFK